MIGGGAMRASDEARTLETLVDALRASRKYRDVHRDTLARAARLALRAADASPSLQLKRAKERLHQWFGAYRVHGGSEWDAVGKELAALDLADVDGCRRLGDAALARHASTRERERDREAICSLLREELSGARVVLDLCAGATAFLLPSIGLDSGVEYIASDVDSRLVALVRDWLARTGRRGTAEWRDVIADPPRQRCDVALLLKSAPCLERQEEGATERLLRALDADVAVLSFPVRSLGGRGKGMAENYLAFARALEAKLGVPLVERPLRDELFCRFALRERAP